jgi:uncharacterized RDD family membrane protein YckC
MSSMPPPPPPPPPGAMPPAAPPGYTPYASAQQAPNYASFGGRLGAYLIDVIVIGLISLPFEIGGWLALRKAYENCFSVDDGNTTKIFCPDGAFQGGWLAAAIVLFVLGVLVGLIIYCKKVAGGQSWGQKAIGIKIVDIRSGTSISAGRVFLRQICRIFSQLFCFLGYFWMLWDSQKQTWHDKMVNTIVVKA